MTIYFIIRNFIHEFISVIHSRLSLARFQSKNSTCRFYLGSKISNVIFGSYVVLYENVRIGNSSIGSYSYVQKNSNIFNSEIGKFCSIAAGVSIGLGLHEINRVSTHPVFFSKDTPLPKVFANENLYKDFKRSIIENDVWIGEGAIVLDGISIGTGAVIAAGAVVTKDVMPYCIVGGVPAKIIKKRFDDKTINSLIESQWWDNTDEWFRLNYALFSDTSTFLTQYEKI